MAIKKRMPVFWKVYIAVGVLLLAALGVWLLFLVGWLSDFEASQPKYAAEKTFNEYFADFDAEKFVRECEKNGGLLETAENITAYLEKLTDGKKLSYKKVSSGMEDSYKYIVLCDEKTKIASFSLAEDTAAGGKFKTYKTVSLELFYDSNTKYTIEAPKGYSVLVNGKELGGENITKDDIPTESCDYMPEGVSGIYNTVYTVKGLLSAPTVEVTAPNGIKATVESKDSTFTVKPVYDSELEVEYKDWILEGAEKYAKYSQYDWRVSATGFGQVAPFFDPTSELYESIRTVENMFVIEYDKYEFTDMTASEFTRYDDNTFSCRVQYTQKLYKGNDVYDDFVDQILYLRRVEGEFRIYEMKVN